jgi:hypothetical protein
LKINANEKVILRDILRSISADRKLIVIDACRNYIDDSEYFHFTGDVETTAEKPLVFPSRIAFTEARRIFLDALNNTAIGTQILYSCSLGESSVITKDGSHYSKSMLIAVKAWSLRVREYSILLGCGAHDYTKIVIKRYRRKQTPRMSWSNEFSNFPFAIRFGAELL